MADMHMQASSVDPVIDARQNAMVASGVNVPIANVNTLKTWIRDARNEIARQVAIEDTNNFVILGPTTINTTIRPRPCLRAYPSGEWRQLRCHVDDRSQLDTAPGRRPADDFP
jgi:hypothetical protein